MKLSFNVAGIPSPGGSKNAFAIKKGGFYTGRVAVTDAGGKKTKLWRQTVAWEAKRAIGQGKALSGPLSLTVIFCMPRPQSHFKGKAKLLRPDAPYWVTTKPDTTKLLRSTEDAMKGILWADDSQVCQQQAWKIYSTQPGAMITVEEVTSLAMPPTP